MMILEQAKRELQKHETNASVFYILGNSQINRVSLRTSRGIRIKIYSEVDSQWPYL